MKAARDHQTGNFALAQFSKSPDAQFRRQTFEIGMLRGPEHLHALLGKISIETREREPGAIDGGLTNFPMEPHTRSFQLHMQLLGVGIVEAVHGNNRDTLLPIALRGDRLSAALFYHED